MTDWTVVGHNSHPIPADPGGVRAMADDLRATAATLAEQATQLRRVSETDFWDSCAADAFREQIGDLPHRFDQLEARYATTAGALDAYEPEVAAARADAEHARARAEAAVAELARAEAGIAQMEQWDRDEAARVETTNAALHQGPPTVPQPWPGEDHRAAAATAAAERDRAVAEVASAVERWERAAEAAAHEVDAAIDDGLRNATGVRAAIRRGARWVADRIPLAQISAVLGTVAGVLGIASLLLGWVPIVGQVLVAAALIVGAAALICDVILWAAGEGSGWAVLSGVLGIATAGLGRAVGVARTAHLARGAQRAAGNDRAFRAAHGVRHPQRIRPLRRRVMADLRPMATGPRLGFLPSGAAYRQAYRPVQNVQRSWNEVRGNPAAHLRSDPRAFRLETARLDRLRPYGLAPESGASAFTSAATQHVGTFTGEYGRQAQVLQLVHTGRSIAGVGPGTFVDLARGEGFNPRPVGSGILYGREPSPQPASTGP